MASVGKDLSQSYDPENSLRLAEASINDEKFNEAEHHLTNALKLGGCSAQTYYLLGYTFFKQQRLEEAKIGLLKALNLGKKNADLYFLLSDIFYRKDFDVPNALRYLNDAIAYSPNNRVYKKRAAALLQDVSFYKFFPFIKQIITALLKEKGAIDIQRISNAWCSTLLHDPLYTPLLNLLKSHAYNIFLDSISKYTHWDIFEEGFITIGLKELMLRSISFELFFTNLRHFILDAVSNDDEHIILSKRDIIKAMAQQCFYNEFIWFVSEEEKEKISKLKDKINKDSSTTEWLILACYLPLSEVNADNIPRDNLELQEIISKQIDEPSEEVKIKEKINSLTEIDDNTSIEVSNQYEKNPYPRWQSIEKVEPISLSSYIKQSIPHLNTQFFDKEEGKKMLIAGCGTGKHGIYQAQILKGINILAVDLSRASLAYGIRKANEIKVKNIEFKQADILKLNCIKDKFDVIESVGVLHHMKDPVKGWKVLTDLLHPEGVMKIALYSESGRKNIVEIRDIISKNKYSHDKEGIRSCRFDLMTKYLNIPSINKVFFSKDFYSISACRDLIFHVQEHRFTLPQIKKISQDLNLELVHLGVARQDYLLEYDKSFPDDKNRTSFDNWHQLEQKHQDMFDIMYHMWFKKNNN